jgi:DNA processing protein
MDSDELKAWLRLLLSPGLGRRPARQLLQALGSPQAVFDARAADWQALGLARHLPALAQEPPDLAAQLAHTLAWVQGEDCGVLTLGDAAYPASLLDIEDPPLLLFVQGAMLRTWQAGQGQDRLNLAVVGSRNPTPQGELNARQFSQALAGLGVCVVSGLALGIDGAAHLGALEGGGDTLAVLGTGLDRVYPRRHLALAQRIRGQGALISEFPLSAPPLSHHFPQRNRVIAGLARATLVVEANLQSGSLITARLAAEQGKEVLAIPGSIHSPQSRGCHLLIQQGARLVSGVQDVLEELQWGLSLPASPSPAGESGHALLRALGWEPMDLDSLQQRCGWPTEQLQAQLLELELAGEVAHLPGGRYQRLARA